MPLILTQFIFSDLEQKLLCDPVTSHVSLDNRSMLVLVQLDDREYVILISRASPGMLDSAGSLDPVFLKSVVDILTN